MPARWILGMLLLSCLHAEGVVIDRIAVTVDKRAIKTSDIQRDMRVTEFLNSSPLDTSAAVQRRTAERLIDQAVIRQAMERGGYSQSTASEVDGMLKKLLADRFGGSDARLQQDLARYGLNEAQLRMQLQWQLDVLAFIEERFRPAVLVTDDQVKSYYDQHRAELAHQFPGLQTYDAVAPKIRASLEGQQLNKAFDDWLAAARKRAKIAYHEGAFQ